MRIIAKITVIVFAACFFSTSIIEGQISEAFLERIQELGSKPSTDELVNFGEFLRDSEVTLSPEERERGDRVMTYAISSFSSDEIPSLLERLTGVRSAGLVRIALSSKSASGEIANGASSYIESTPEGVVDYFLNSSDGTRRDGDLLFDLKDEAVRVLLDEMASSTQSRRKLRTIGLLTQVIRKKGPELNQDLKNSAMEQVGEQIELLDPDDRKLALGYLKRVGPMNNEDDQDKPAKVESASNVFVAQGHSSENRATKKEIVESPLTEFKKSKNRTWPIIVGVIVLLIIVILVRAKKSKGDQP